MSTTNYKHGVFASDKTVAPATLRVSHSGAIGIIGTAPDADTSIWPLNRPVEIVGDFKKADTLGGKGSLLRNLRGLWSQYEKSAGKIVVVRVEHNNDPAKVQSAMVGDTAQKTGVHAFLNASNLVGFEPDILIAPEYATAQPGKAANPVAVELEVVAKRLRSVFFIDGPNSNSADAKTARAVYGSDRGLFFDPAGLVWDGASNSYVPLSLATLAAGVQSRLDIEQGFWHSLSNKPVYGIGGSVRAIDWRAGDTGSEANDLNSHQITTLIRKIGPNVKNGFRLWGGETLDTAKVTGGTIVGRRVADKVYDALETGLDFMVDEPFSLHLLKEAQATVSNFLSDLVRRGALVRADFSLPEDLNSPAQWAAGRMLYRLDYVEAGPIREVEIWGYRTPKFYEEFITRAAALSGLGK